jgi:uncharacterized alpha-E superfamily protein
MLSRIAESLFWLTRYMERNDGLLRAIKTGYILSLEKSPNAIHTWRPVLETFTALPAEQIAEMEQNTPLALQYLILETDNLNSAKVMIAKARENARGVQDNITKEVWEQVNHLFHYTNNASLQVKLDSNEALGMIDNMLQGSILFAGITDVTMPRNRGWGFLSLGKYIERCLLTIELADKYFREVNYNLEDDKDILYWRNLLLSLSGYELHLKYYHTSFSTRNVAEQILFNDAFPRSVNYTLKHVEKYLRKVIAENTPLENAELSRYFGRLFSQVQFADFDQINEVGLQEYFRRLRFGLIHFSKLLGEAFFLYN